MKYPDRARVSLSVKGECPRQRSRRCKTIDAWHERQSADIGWNTKGISRTARFACKEIIRSGVIKLRLHRHCISRMYRSCEHGSGRETGDRCPRRHT